MFVGRLVKWAHCCLNLVSDFSIMSFVLFVMWQVLKESIALWGKFCKILEELNTFDSVIVFHYVAACHPVYCHKQSSLPF